MSGFISFFTKTTFQKALRLPQQTNPQSSFNDDRVACCPKPQDTSTLTNKNSGNGKERPTMSGLEQENHLGEQSNGGGYAGSDNDVSTPATSSSVINSNSSQPQETGSFFSPGHTGNHQGIMSRRITGYTETTSTNVSSALSEALLAARSGQYVPPQTDPNPMDRRGSLNDNLEIDDIGGQELLPEDDGMSVLRKKIHAIRDLGSTSSEQARLIHNLMTESYNASRAMYPGQTFQATSPTSCPRTPEHPKPSDSRWSDQSLDSRFAFSTPLASSILRDLNNTLTDEDLKPTFHPKAEPDLSLGDSEDVDTEEFEELCFGCQHYKRNVKLQCFDCKKWYTCRFCHDEVEDHHLDRPKTENMLCMFCGNAQPASQFCSHCGEQAALYYCAVCKLWDNDPSKSIYHCNDCGICRIGKGLGKDFFHCKTCSVCLPISIETTHRCIERSTQCDCPICGDYMFTSPETVVFMRCGHSIHQRCLSEYSKSSYRCPICSKTITNMETTFRNLDRTIQSQPMPAEFKDTKALVYCNDCNAKSVVKYHWLGLRCDVCESYNTAQLRLLQGDSLDFADQEGESESHFTSRLRSSSQGVDEHELLPSLQTDPSSAPGSGADPRFGAPSSYNLTRGRAVSPVISNYFGIPPERDSERPKSTSFFGSRSPEDEGEVGDGELYIWGTKIKYRYGFLKRQAEKTDEVLESESEGGEVSVHSDSEEDISPDEEEEDDDDDEDDDESIDIFGHR